MKKTVLSAICAAILLASPHIHAGYKEAEAAYEKEDFATAFKEWKPLAETGNADAQFALFFLFAEGKGVAQNNEEAIKWLTKAAKNRHDRALINIFIFYKKGLLGVKQSDQDAIKWGIEAADYTPYISNNRSMRDNNARQSINKYLANAFYYGKGVEKNLNKACHYISDVPKESVEDEASIYIDCVKSRAESGDSTAAIDLAGIYAKGRLVKSDSIEAKKWFLKYLEAKGINAGSHEGMFKYGEFLYSHHDTEKGFDLIKKSASLGYHEAQNWLGNHYQSLNNPDLNKAVEWLLKAAKQGNADAKFNLGLLYFNGNKSNRMEKDPYKDLAKALEWFKKASDSGHDEAKFYVASGEGNFDAQYRLLKINCPIGKVEWYDLVGYIKDSIGNRTKEELFELGTACRGKNDTVFLMLAAEKGHPKAAFMMSEMFTSPETFRERVKYLKIAVDGGDPQAQYTRSNDLLNPLGGRPTKQDIEEGMRLLRLSAEQAYAPAQKKLSDLEKTAK